MSMQENDLVELINKTIKSYRGDSRKLSNAIGYLCIGRQFGWRVMLLMHDRKTIRGYETILGIESKTFFPETGPMADKSVGYWELQQVTNFWKAAKGEIAGVRTTEIR
jgi:hypothetical protein